MTTFTARFLDKAWEVPVESGRYHLIVGEFCPYAHRPQIARYLLGLEQHISISLVANAPTEQGLVFDGPEPVTGTTSMRELYALTDPNYDGVCSVPVLIDKTTKQIVCKESADILRLFTTTFKDLHQDGAPNLYPVAGADHIQEQIRTINQDFHSLLYKFAFAEDQVAYDQVSHAFFAFLDDMELRLSQQDYVAGDHLTEADIHLYTPLLRWDLVGYHLLQANAKALEEFPNILAWARRVYNQHDFKSVTNIAGIKENYYRGKFGQAILKRSIIPAGPSMTKWEG